MRVLADTNYFAPLAPKTLYNMAGAMKCGKGGDAI